VETPNVVSLPAVKQQRSTESIDAITAELAARQGCSLDEARARLDQAAEIVMQRPDIQAEIESDSELALDAIIAIATQARQNHLIGMTISENAATVNAASFELARERLIHQALSHGVAQHWAERYTDMISKVIGEMVSGDCPGDEIKAFIRSKEDETWRRMAKPHHHPKPPNKSGRRTKKR
jgi:lambda repressor-like predicted transcriptional regulator